MAMQITGTSGATYELRGHTVWLVGTLDIPDMALTTVFHTDDFGTAVEVEDEEMRCLMAAARAEFGL